MEPVEELKVTPVIDNKPVPRGELVGDALSVISLKTPSDDSDPDRVVKRNSYRNLHRPNISHLDWVSQSSSKEQEVLERVKSFHSSRRSLVRSVLDGSVSDVAAVSSGSASSARGLRQYSPAERTIKEESPEAVTRTNTGADEATRPQPADDDVTEYVIGKQTLGQLEQWTADVDAIHEQPASTVQQRDQQKPPADGRRQSGSRSTVTTEFSRHFEFADDDAETRPEAGAGAARGAWSREEIERLESRADSVLVHTLPDASADEQQQEEERDDLEELERAAQELTRDAFDVSVQRTNAAGPIPLSLAAVEAAETITMDVLYRALSDDVEPTNPQSTCGRDHIKFASAIVRRVLNALPSGDTKWSMSARQAASVVVDDVMAAAIVHASRAGVAPAATRPAPDHVWSREAITASRLMVGDVMAAAARRVEAAKQRPTARQRRRSHLHSGMSRDEIVDVDLADERHHVQPPPPPAAQKTAASSPTSELASACECCYDQDTFSDSDSESATNPAALREV